MNTILYASQYISQPTTAKSGLLNFEKYLLSNGLIYQVGAGLYINMPLLKIMITNIENNIARFYQEELHAVPIELTSIQPEKYFLDSGRLDIFNGELFKLQDRNGRSYILSPTNEEIISEVHENMYSQHSEKGCYYQIDKKFRDELGSRAISRSREFRMAELYMIMNKENYDKENTLAPEKVFNFLKTLGCDCHLRDSKETKTSRYSGNLSKEIRVKTLLNTGIKNEQGESLLELAKWTPLGNVYAKDKNFYMSCLGIGSIRVMLHHYELLSNYSPSYLPGIINWPEYIMPYKTAIVLNTQNQPSEIISNFITETSVPLIVDDRYKLKTKSRIDQLFSLGVNNLIIPRSNDDFSCCTFITPISRHEITVDNLKCFINKKGDLK